MTGMTGLTPVSEYSPMKARLGKRYGNTPLTCHTCHKPQRAVLHGGA
jgi:hypothetical protein